MGWIGKSLVRKHFLRVFGRIAAYLMNSHISRPIFIIAPPRSGSTYLFECLRRLDEIIAPSRESDQIWWRIFPYRSPNPSDYVGVEQALPININRLRRGILSTALRTKIREADYPWRELSGIIQNPRGYRILDKTIANCFHLDFLDRAYPDSNFVFLVRDPRSNISSMIESWAFIELVGKPNLSQYISSEATISHWSFPAPPGWQKQIHRPLAEICAWIWQQHIEYALCFLKSNPTRVVHLSFEALNQEPADTINWLSRKLDIQVSADVLAYAEKKLISRTTISEPELDKWRKLNYDEIMKIIPMIEQTASKIGYQF